MTNSTNVTNATNEAVATASHRTAVLGLGPMGVALAAALLGAGADVAVWNRTPKELDVLGLGDARAAQTPSDAAAAADVVVVCVRDHAVGRDVIAALADELPPDAVVVHASTGTPQDAAESATRARELGVRYVTAAIMVPTPLIGTPENTVLYAGDPEDVARARPILEMLGGTVDVVGDDHRVPPALDLAMLDVFFAGMYAYLHATALAEANGIDAERFLPYGETITRTLGHSLAGLAANATARGYDTGQARLDMCTAFLDKIVAASSEAGVDAAHAAVVRDASWAALRHRAAGTDWDVVFEDLRPR
ncbi:NAD(P)-dependent oxidoreductase [Rhodococcus rhodnii]|uniref:Uncharacterized protein n=2 Tax=Rhodococcus rhodnii TaxID=38312 RepID=R7WL31_9NOCA|nr:NAD(P)-binding domain-containing protein [Rhodococcus rhodnii]EOM76007.1 hypothetical protein Rrhod_2655 [Rhodococcus rhodnii LMG 5362]TXG90847.1 NAD(P)-dependent oxidoreductase [Rhodococcus rhodnii]